DGRPIGFQHIGAVEVLREPARIDRTAFKVPADRNALVRIELLRHLGPYGVEYPGFLGEVSAPVGSVDLAGLQFTRHVGVPMSKGRPALAPVHSTCQEDDEGDRQQDHGSPYCPDDRGAHFSTPVAITRDFRQNDPNTEPSPITAASAINAPTMPTMT